MSNLVMNKTVMIAMLFFSLLSSSTDAKSLRWRELRDRKLIAFDWNCSQKQSFPSPALDEIVRRAIAPEDRAGPTTYGDRAFAIGLRKQWRTVYFVPTVCGATGNCTWRLYTIDPVRYHGEISGQYVYTYQASRGMPTIVTYGHLSVSEGILSTYAYRNGRYKWLGDQYPVDYQKLNGYRMPRFLERAKPRCKEYGL